MVTYWYHELSINQRRCHVHFREWRKPEYEAATFQNTPSKYSAFYRIIDIRSSYQIRATPIYSITIGFLAIQLGIHASAALKPNLQPHAHTRSSIGFRC